MLENGADIRVIQEMLGHAKLSTTVLYTRVSINLLKQVYLATHPGASEKRAELVAMLEAEAEEEDVMIEVMVQVPHDGGGSGRGIFTPCWRGCAKAPRLWWNRITGLVAVIKAPQGQGRPIAECIAIAKAYEERLGYAPIPDEDFAKTSRVVSKRIVRLWICRLGTDTRFERTDCGGTQEAIAQRSS